MNHAEHDESIGSMLASIAAALREVSDKLDVVAARVRQEVPAFPADEDLPDQTRIRRLETWAFHASQDISRLSARLDALDGGDPEPAPRARGTRSRREVREAAEAAERAAADPAAGEELSAPAGNRPPLERRHSRTDHLGDPTWPLTVAPVPRPSATFEPASEPAAEAAPIADTARAVRSGRAGRSAEGYAAGGVASPTGSAVGTVPEDTAESDDAGPVNGTQRALPLNGTDRVPPVNGRAQLNGASRVNGAKPLNGVRAVDETGALRELRTRGDVAVDDPIAVPRTDANSSSRALPAGADASVDRSGVVDPTASADDAAVPVSARGDGRLAMPQRGNGTAGAAIRNGRTDDVAAPEGQAHADVGLAVSGQGSGIAGASPVRRQADDGEARPDHPASAPQGDGLGAAAGTRQHADPLATAQRQTRGAATTHQRADGAAAAVSPDRQTGHVASAATTGRQDDEAGAATTQREANEATGRQRADRLATAGAEQQTDDVVPTDSAREWADRLAAAAAEQPTGDVVPTATAREWADRLAAAAAQQVDDVVPTATAREWADRLAAAAERDGALTASAGRSDGAGAATATGGVAAQLGSVNGRALELSDDSVIEAVEWQVTQRLPHNGASRGGEAGGSGRDSEVVGRTASISALGRNGTSPGSGLSGSNVAGAGAGAGDELTLPGSAEAGVAARGGDGVINGVVAPQANAGAVDTMSDPPTETGVRPPTEAAVERARPVGKPAGGTTGPVVGAGSAPGSSEALSGSRIGEPERVVSDPRSAGLTAGDRGETTNGYQANGFDPRSAGTPGSANSGSTTSGIHWTFTDEDLTTPSSPSVNGHTRNGFTGDAQRAGSIFDDVAPRERLTTSGDTLPSAPPARLSAPKEATPVAHTSGGAPEGFDAPSTDHGNVGLEPAGGYGSEPTRTGGFAADASGPDAPATSPLDRVVSDPVPPTATDAAGITVTGTFRAFDIERAQVDKLQAMLDELKRSAGLPPGPRDVFGPPTTEPG
ncbi:hypothetical protein [Nocardia sp. MW-W600-9]